MNICNVERCEHLVLARGLCGLHYARVRRTGDIGDDGRKFPGGYTGHPMYPRYRAMLQRCYNPRNKYYEYYGGRGIKVCDRWRQKGGFLNFLEDMGTSPPGLTLDRKDNDGDYSPDNCRWAGRTTQQINQRLSKVNTSGTKGVHWSKRANLWAAYIDFLGERTHLGYYKTKEEAVIARLEAELERARNVKLSV